MATCEPLNLSRSLTAVPDISMSISFWPAAANAIVAKGATELIRNQRPFAPIMKAMWETIEGEQGATPEIHFWATAKGELDGTPTQATVYGTQDWAKQQGGRYTTAATLHYTAEAMARGDIQESGLLAPVNLFDPDTLFTQLAGSADHGIQIEVEPL